MSYNWNFAYVGGVPRVKIATGEDIAHLGELNEKMWTVLSCPVKGLEIDEKSLDYMDTNKDGLVHVSEVVATVEWLKKSLKNLDILTTNPDTIPLAVLNEETEEGQQLLAAAKHILEGLGKADAAEISLADSSSSLESFLNTKLEALKAERAAQTAVEAPFADQTEAVAEAYAALDAKVKDYFLRSRLAGFAAESTAALDVQVAQIEAISAANLTEKTADIAGYPIARITGTTVLPLDAAINPAWAAQWAVVKPFFKEDITEASWAEVGAKLAAFADYNKSLEVSEADIELDEETKSIQLVDKLLHLTRDFYTLVRNYVTFTDFYTPDEKAVFQAGRLYIDQRACDLCVKVADAGAMAAQAANSGMFLVFCDCTNKVLGQTMQIVAALTVGDINNIKVGKNAIFYDRQGNDWDARVTNIIDNPISIKQAFWSPYKKMGNFLEEKIRSMAASKESAITDKATASIDAKADAAAASTAEATTAGAEGSAATAANAKDAGKAAASSFDIAKFAGIFAAIGMAIGFIGSFITAMVTGFLKLTWWQMPLCIIAILLLISGPSMFLAWMKLRKRNISPILNANGWAVNAAAMINTKFGTSLCEIAKFPLSAKMRKQDPFADKSTPWWVYLLWVLVIAVAVVAACWFFKVFEIPYLPASPYGVTPAA